MSYDITYATKVFSSSHLSSALCTFLLIIIIQDTVPGFIPSLCFLRISGSLSSSEHHATCHVIYPHIPPPLLFSPVIPPRYLPSPLPIQSSVPAYATSWLFCFCFCTYNKYKMQLNVNFIIQHARVKNLTFAWTYFRSITIVYVLEGRSWQAGELMVVWCQQMWAKGGFNIGE